MYVTLIIVTVETINVIGRFRLFVIIKKTRKNNVRQGFSKFVVIKQFSVRKSKIATCLCDNSLN